MSDPCKHKRCVLCGRRECQRQYAGYSVHIQMFGDIGACDDCSRRAVRFALDAAQKFGGSLPADVCGIQRSHHVKVNNSD